MGRILSTDRLAYLMECPVKADFSTKYPVDTISESQAYFGSIRRAAIRLAEKHKNGELDGAVVKEVWKEAATKDVLSKIKPPSKNMLIARGAAVLARLAKFLRGVEVIHIAKPAVMRLNWHKVRGLVPFVVRFPDTGKRANILLAHSRWANQDMTKWDPIKLVLNSKQRDKVWIEFSLFAGSMGTFTGKTTPWVNRRVLKEMCKQALDGPFYPRRGMHCRTCGWKGACRKEYGGLT